MLSTRFGLAEKVLCIYNESPTTLTLFQLEKNDRRSPKQDFDGAVVRSNKKVRAVQTHVSNGVISFSPRSQSTLTKTFDACPGRRCRAALREQEGKNDCYELTSVRNFNWNNLSDNTWLQAHSDGHTPQPSRTKVASQRGCCTVEVARRRAVARVADRRRRYPVTLVIAVGGEQHSIVGARST